ncbi:SDR family oxidoreductase [Halobacillus halophilus]|uniref:SDR family oxidoreductase n=1 Tax=Halobacillus halophilus TaxID=1570 RepID=UPI001CD6FCA8|nr:SDR family oxidoreductase [Halobacillus halophilus]MCA1012925.1 SDR family oxidoreductase [Halobacillus halophilus]
MANTYVCTGFPGYLASNIVEELFFEGYPVDKIYLIHLPEMKELAEQRVKELAKEIYVDRQKIELVPGDITKPGLGLDPSLRAKLERETTHFFHLAALYDLAVSLTKAWRVNVQGTREVNHWLRSFLKLQRYLYFSSAYISGKREGKIYEDELTHQEGFKNHYEYTKYEAEKLVESEKEHLPITIIRPGIVVGHSRTGETLKFDGPYFVLNMLDRFRALPVIPQFGKGDAKVNLVPQDYVIKGSIYLVHIQKSKGKTYHLTDPDPYTAREIYQLFSDTYLERRPMLSLPGAMANQGLQIRSIRKKLGIQKEAMDYFLTKSDYDSTEAQNDLQGSSITCPDLTSYVQTLIDYYGRHKHDQRKHTSLL